MVLNYIPFSCYLGKSFFFGNSNVIIDHSIFEHNSASYYGGCIHSDDRNSIVIKNSLMSSNEAQTGGAVHVGSLTKLSYEGELFVVSKY
jgi:hypothetical protein